MHTVVEQSQMCTQDQGLLGGYDGLPVGANPATSVNMLDPYVSPFRCIASTFLG